MRNDMGWCCWFLWKNHYTIPHHSQKYFPTYDERSRKKSYEPYSNPVVMMVVPWTIWYFLIQFEGLHNPMVESRRRMLCIRSIEREIWQFLSINRHTKRIAIFIFFLFLMLIHHKFAGKKYLTTTTTKATILLPSTITHLCLSFPVCTKNI